MRGTVEIDVAAVAVPGARSQADALALQPPLGEVHLTGEAAAAGAVRRSCGGELVGDGPRLLAAARGIPGTALPTGHG